MLTPIRTSQFKRDVKRIQKRDKDMTKIRELLGLLLEQKFLPDAYRHYLTNTFHKVRGTPMRFGFRSGQNPYDNMAGASDKAKAKNRELSRTRKLRKQHR